MIDKLKNILSGTTAEDSDQSERSAHDDRGALRKLDAEALTLHRKRMSSPSESGLIYRGCARRNAALDACLRSYGAEWDARNGELQRALAEAKRAHDVCVAEAHATVLALRKNLQNGLVDEFYKEAAPLRREFSEDGTRRSAAALSALVQRYIAREDEEIGCRDAYSALAHGLLFYAFCDFAVERAPYLALELGHDGTFTPSIGDAFAGIVRNAYSGQTLQPELERLERALESLIVAQADRPPDQRMTDRYKVKRRLDAEALAAFDREWERKKEVERANAPAAPQPKSRMIKTEYGAYEAPR